MGFINVITFYQNSWKVIDFLKIYIKKPTKFKLPINVKRLYTIQFTDSEFPEIWEMTAGSIMLRMGNPVHMAAGNYRRQVKRVKFRVCHRQED